MTTNHIFLIMRFTNQLADLAMVQNWIDEARKGSPENPKVKAMLDAQQADVLLKKDTIHDVMFEICRSN